MNASANNPQGAVDLSQIAARAQAQSSGQAGLGQPGTSYVVEVTEQTFESEVVRKSSQYPIVVEFYSPRASYAGQLSDALAQLASEEAGRFMVARINVDEAPQITQALGLQSVPTVIGVVGGQMAPLFQGVLEKDQAKGYIDQLLQAAVSNGINGRAEPTGPAPGSDESEAEPDPRFTAADDALQRGDYQAAVAEFDKLLAENPQDSEASAGKAQAGLLARTVGADPEQLIKTADASGAIDDQLAAADVQVATGDAEAGFARLLTVIRSTAGDDRERVRLRLLDLFETVGNSDPRVQKARRDLMTALF